MEKFDLTTGTWLPSFAPGGGANAPASSTGYSAVWDSDNNVIIYFGGVAPITGRSQNISIFDPVTESWLAAGDTPQADGVCLNAADCERSFHSAVYVPNPIWPLGAMFTLGGFNDTLGNEDNSFWAYTYAAGAGTWVKLVNDLPGGGERADHAMAYDSNGLQVCFYGGQRGGVTVGVGADYFCYDILLTTWGVDLASGIVVPIEECTMSYDSVSNLFYLGGRIDAAFTINNIIYSAAPGGAFTATTFGYSAENNPASVYINDVFFMMGGRDGLAFILDNCTAWANNPAVAITLPQAVGSGISYSGTLTITGTNTNAGRNTASTPYWIARTSPYNAANLITNGATLGILGALAGSETLTAAIYPNDVYTLRTIVTDVLGFSTTSDTAFQITNPAPAPPPPPPPPPPTPPGPSVDVSVIEASSLPQEFVPFDDEEGGLYEYVKLNKEGLDTDGPVIITFSVEKSWFESKDIDPMDLRLNWYNEGVWSELPTEYQDETETHYVYQTQLYTITEYFAVAARTGDCRDFGCGDNEDCSLVKDSYFCVPLEQGCDLTCPQGQTLDQSTCSCVTADVIDLLGETSIITIGVAILSAFLLMGLYVLLTRKPPQAPPSPQQKLEN